MEEQKPTFKAHKRPLLEILEDFKKPIPERLLKTKTVPTKRGSYTATYCPWYTYIKLLEYLAPGFKWEVRVTQIGDRAVVEGRLTIYCEEGEVTREATGNEDNELDSYGDPISNAEAMALRRACAKFGLGLHLWEK